MFCTTCGKKLSDDAMFCAYCGTSLNMKRREENSVEQLQVSQTEPQSVQPQDSQPLTQSVQPQDSQPLTQPVQMQIPQPITLPVPPQISQSGPQPTQPQISQPTQQQASQAITQPIQPQGFQSTPQSMQPQSFQSIPHPMQPQGYQQVQNPRVQYVARPVGTPVAGVTESPKKKRGWIVPVVLVTVIVVVGLSYLAYRVLVAYLRDAMDAAYREQYHEWHSSDYDTERPWNIPGFSHDDPDDPDETHDSEELLPSDEDNGQDEDNEQDGDKDQDGKAEEDNNPQPDQPDWNDGNNSNSWGDDVYAYDGSGIGYVGDIMHTYWFDFTVNNTLFSQSFQGYTAREGYQLIVLDLSIENTFEEEVPMSDWDFWVEWGDNNYDFDYSFPVADSYDISLDFLPEHYYLPTDDIVTGLLMFEVPVGYSEYMLIFEEYFENEEVGDWFGVYLYSNDGSNIHTL